MDQTALLASSAFISFRVSTFCVARWVVYGAGSSDIQSSRVMGHGAKDIVENVMDSHGHFARRHGGMPESLRHVSPVSFKGSGAQRRPYESFDNAFFAGVEGVHVRV